MLEKRIETVFVKATHQRGGLCLKFVSPSMAGVPDRLVLLPDGHMGFVEMKAPGKHPRPLQVQRINQLKRLGYQVFVCDQFDQIGGMLDAIQAA
ncbi:MULTISPECIES: VRR-NUC domain-containing protein [Lactobacillaceae]|uniref:VRR-NUC domain-containing protein n=1 Tax=Lactobacillaceae TaxID=33958 RepID=UPI00336A23DC